MKKYLTDWRIRTIDKSNEEGGNAASMPIDEAEVKRANAEKKREEAENSRATAESKRVDAESKRVSAETNRSKAESERAIGEKARKDAEGKRKDAEIGRDREEKKRQEEEIRRQVQEEYRQKEEERRRKEEEARKKEEERRLAEEKRKIEEERRRLEEIERKKKEEEERKEKEAAYRESLKERAIVFHIGDETNIVVAKTQQQIEHSPLKEQYAQALRIVDEILAQSPADEDKGSENTAVSNIVAFCGDRGEGKTSALMTTREILLGDKTFEEARKANILPEDRHFKENTFKVLRLVDPAFFDKNHNLLELLIGQMYAEVLRKDKELSEKSEYNICDMKDNVALRNRLMQCFQNVRSSLGIINRPSDKSAYDNLEEIDELAIGIALREKVDELMCCYAKYFQKERVLICVDDLDLNVSEGYKMAEEIRKYLCNPRACVVLMSIKVEQMIEVAQSYLRNKMAKDIIPDSTITEMAVRYVTKLLPTPHRVVMPKGEGIVELPVIIEDNKSNEPPFESVKDAIVKLIYRKTRYIFVNGRNVSPIVPTNLRSLRFLINLLWELPDAKRENNADNVENKQIFKNYFYNTWIGLLDSNDAKFAQEIIYNPDITTLNKSVVMHLRNLALPAKIQEEHDVLVSILDPQNQVQNISVGDVFYVIKQVESINTDIRLSYFLFFLKAFYSIELYETYDRLSANLDSLFVTPSACFSKVQEVHEREKNNSPYIYKYDSQLQKLNLLQRFLNGAYFTFRKKSLIPSEQGGNERDLRLIDGKNLRAAFEKVKDNKISDEQRLGYLHLCEFFALTTIRSAKNNDKLITDRTQSGRTYFDTYLSSNKYFVFDVLSIFYNVVNIQFAYNRWDKIFKEDFFAYAYNNEQSLLKQTLALCDRPYDTPDSTLPSNIHHFISDAVIRFSEVMLSIIDNAENQRDVYSEGGNANNLRIFYDNIRKIGITLYPLDPNDKTDNGYKMEFLFLDKVVKLLSDIADVEDKLRKEERGENVDISDYERFIESQFSAIYVVIAGNNESNESSDTPISLEKIFANSLTKKRTRYPKTKDQILYKLKWNDSKLYNANTEFWLQILDNKSYSSWRELKEELSQHIDEIRELYQKTNN